MYCGRWRNNLRTTGFHPTLQRQLPEGCRYFQLEEIDAAINGTDLIIGGVSSFGVEWFAKEVLPRMPGGMPMHGMPCIPGMPAIPGLMPGAP